MSRHVIVLMPAYNEATKITASVRSALSIDGVKAVVVIDDCSRDDTARRARDAGAAVIEFTHNRGKGTALEVGADVAMSRTCIDGIDVGNADMVLLLDADLGESATEGALLLPPLIADEADMTIATFPKTATKAGFGLVKNRAARAIATLGDGFEATAPLSGQRALTRECLAAVRPFGTGYGVEVALTVCALRNGMRVQEVPTAMSHTETGRDFKGFIHRGRQFIDVTRAISHLKR